MAMQLTATNLLHTGNVTTGLVATDSGIFGSNVTATVTNWLGSCILACSGGKDLAAVQSILSPMQHAWVVTTIARMHFASYIAADLPLPRSLLFFGPQAR